MRRFKRQPSSIEALWDELDRADLLAAVPEHPAARVVEGVDVAEAQASPSVTIHPSSKAIWVMKPRMLPAGGLREPNAVGLKLGERVCGKVFRAGLDLDAWGCMNSMRLAESVKFAGTIEFLQGMSPRRSYGARA